MTIKRISNKHNYGNTLPPKNIFAIFLWIFFFFQNLEWVSPFDNFAIRKQMTSVSWSQHSINLLLSSYFYRTYFCLMHLIFLNCEIFEWKLVKYFITHDVHLSEVNNICMWDVHLLLGVIIKFVTIGVILRLGESVLLFIFIL
jgi:hypothetical protein